MNFLAHIYLSGENPKIMVGNFIGDFVKGRNAMEQFDTEIIKGIELHRAIDEFTDSHPLVKESKSRLQPKYRHYSGVIVDIFYDHFLARNWSEYHHQILPDFADHAYDTLQSFETILPEEVKFLMPYMIKGNWLVNYSRVEGIAKALTGMSRRTRFNSKMEEAPADLLEKYDLFDQEFRQFFPFLRNHAANWIQMYQGK